MQIHLLLLGLYCFIGTAKASLWASGYQMLFFYNAYRSDVEVYGLGNTEIANTCRGAGSSGLCNLAEFIHNIIIDGHKAVFWQNAPESLFTLTPDVMTASATLQDMSSKQLFHGAINFPSLWSGYVAGESYPYGDVLEKIVTVIQACRAVISGNSIDGFIDDARTAWQYTYEHREADMAEGMIDSFKNGIYGRAGLDGVSLVTSTTTTTDGRTVQAIDHEATLAPYTSDSIDDIEVRAQYLGFVRNFGVVAGTDPTAFNHQKVLNKMQTASASLYGPSTC